MLPPARQRNRADKTHAVRRACAAPPAFWRRRREAGAAGDPLKGAKHMGPPDESEGPMGSTGRLFSRRPSRARVRYFSVAYMTALMVCMRFSASSNTLD